jgi:hypothetical protein
MSQGDICFLASPQGFPEGPHSFDRVPIIQVFNRPDLSDVAWSIKNSVWNELNIRKGEVCVKNKKARIKRPICVCNHKAIRLLLLVNGLILLSDRMGLRDRRKTCENRTAALQNRFWSAER